MYKAFNHIMKRLSYYFCWRTLQVTYDKHIHRTYNQVKIVDLRSNTPFNSSKWFFYYKNIHHYKNNAFPHHWFTMGPESKDNGYTMQFGDRLCRQSASAVRKRGISCPELRYKIYHDVWYCCCSYTIGVTDAPKFFQCGIKIIRLRVRAQVGLHF